MSSANVSAAPATHGVRGIDFAHPDGRANARGALDDLWRMATRSLRCAVCFFTGAGAAALARHAAALRRDGSFVVVSIEPPTNLNAVLRLHALAPGHVFLHLGGATPVEKDVDRPLARALMHSKVFLAEGEEVVGLWVGSHNLTAQAIGGGNFEAAVNLRCEPDAVVVRAALAHLEECRSSAEPFDPASMERYVEIQRRRRRGEDRAANVTVIHCEALQLPTTSTFFTRLEIAPENLDSCFPNDVRVHLYLHPLGSLQPGRVIDLQAALGFQGQLTSFGHTSQHRRNPGVVASFMEAHFQITIGSELVAPTFGEVKSAAGPVTSQGMIRVDGPLTRQPRVYSLSGDPMTRFTGYVAGQPELSDIDEEIASFFTLDSLRSGKLVYRPIEAAAFALAPRAYPEDVPIDRDVQSFSRGTGGLFRLEAEVARPERAIDSFVFRARRILQVPDEPDLPIS